MENFRMNKTEERMLKKVKELKELKKQIAELQEEVDDIKYHTLYSNECIELWFLLHFEYLQSAIHRNDYYPKLSNHLDVKYQKNMNSVYQMLKPFMKVAIANAKRLDESYSKLPATKMYEIFDFLKKV